MTGTCETPGCFNTAEGGKLCGQCLDGEPPLKRGPVTQAEVMRARAVGGEDAEVTRQRLRLHGQPLNGL